VAWSGILGRGFNVQHDQQSGMNDIMTLWCQFIFLGGTLLISFVK
jgi:hypothetical protein